ncbi:MAG: phosphoenolpyruvate kinase [Acidobacteriota bacterium]
MILDNSTLGEIFSPLDDAEEREAASSGHRASATRRPLHTVYGGAHLFEATTARKLGRWALRHFDHYFPTFVDLAEALELRGFESLPRPDDPRLAVLARLEQDPLTVDEADLGTFLAASVYRRVRAKLVEQPVEDYRIDFEQGLGRRDDEEEDDLARQAAQEVAFGLEAGSLPPRLGLRLRSFRGAGRRRSARTLDLFFTELAERCAALDVETSMPSEFTVALPRASSVHEIEALAHMLELVERHLGLVGGALRIELTIDSPDALLDGAGRHRLPSLLDASAGRCSSVHLDLHDYAAACDIVSTEHGPRHPSCDHARHVIKASLAGRPVDLVDGPSHHLPIAPYRQASGGPPLTEREERRNRWMVHRVSKLNHDDIRHALTLGVYRGWDLHPAQLPIRYAAVYSFFLERLRDSTRRLRSAIDRALHVARPAGRFEDEASSRGLLAFFRRGYTCGALSEDDIVAAGLSVAELAQPSLRAALEARRHGLDAADD